MKRTALEVFYKTFIFFYVAGIFVYILPGALYRIVKDYPTMKADEFREKRLKYYK